MAIRGHASCFAPGSARCAARARKEPTAIIRTLPADPFMPVHYVTSKYLVCSGFRDGVGPVEAPTRCVPCACVGGALVRLRGSLVASSSVRSRCSAALALPIRFLSRAVLLEPVSVCSPRERGCPGPPWGSARRTPSRRRSAPWQRLRTPRLPQRACRAVRRETAITKPTSSPPECLASLGSCRLVVVVAPSCTFPPSVRLFAASPRRVRPHTYSGSCAAHWGRQASVPGASTMG